MQNPYADLPMADKLLVREAAYQHLALSWIAGAASDLGWTTLEQRSPLKVSVESGTFALDRSALGRRRIQAVAARVESELRKLDVDGASALAELADEDLKTLAEKADALCEQTGEALSATLDNAGIAISDDMASSARMIVASFSAPSLQLSASLNR